MANDKQAMVVIEERHYKDGRIQRKIGGGEEDYVLDESRG